MANSGIVLSGEARQPGPIEGGAAAARPDRAVRISRVSTDGLRPDEGFAFWRETVGRYLRQDMAPADDGAFHCSATIYDLPNIHIVRSSHSPYRVTRSRAMTAGDPDRLFLCICHEGRAEGCQRSREVTLLQGDAVLWASDQPLAVDYGASASRTFIGMPRSLIASAVVDLDAIQGQRLPASDAALGLLKNYLALLLPDLEAADAGLLALAGKHINDLMIAMLGPGTDATELVQRRGVRAARLRMIKSDIHARLGQRNLTLEALGRRHGLSPRYIRHLFESDGTSLTEFLMQQRLARAHRLLIDPEQAGRTISSIAAEAGFGDISHFNHCFRRNYGMAPTDARAAAKDAAVRGRGC